MTEHDNGLQRMATDGNGYMARIEELQRRAEHADADRQRVWERLSAGDRQMGVIENEVKHVREDVVALGHKLTAQTRWLAGTALSFTALVVTIIAIFG